MDKTLSTDRKDQNCKRSWGENLIGAENFEDLIRWIDSSNFNMDLKKTQYLRMWQKR
jgi:hypothetical protein